jgi:hypothetical protein
MFGRREPSGEEIARRAHELYLQRGGEHGKDVDDWLTADKDLGEEPVAEPAKTGPSQGVRSRQGARERQQTPRLDGPAFPSSRERGDLFVRRGPARPFT